MSSGTGLNTQGADGPPGDPSMADILASIRRILSEDEPAVSKLPEPPAGSSPAAVHQRAATNDDDILVLDQSMLVEAPVAAVASLHEPEAPAPSPSATVIAAPFAEHQASPEPVSSTRMSAAPELPAEPPSPAAAPVVVPPPLPEGVSQKAAWPQPVPALAEPVTVATAASSLVNLVRTVAAERTASIQRNGVSIEDVVREEVRPLLKAWLDMHLPPLVERLVQAEIERVVNRAAS